MAAPQRVRAVLDVALRVPPVFIIDAILNSAHDASAGYLAVLAQLLLTLLGKRYTLCAVLRTLLEEMCVYIIYISCIHGCHCVYQYSPPPPLTVYHISLCILILGFPGLQNLIQGSPMSEDHSTGVPYLCISQYQGSPHCTS